jgi:hypothetical protein
MATPWLTGAGAVGHMRISWTVEAHVAAQEREIAMLRCNPGEPLYSFRPVA